MAKEKAPFRVLFSNDSTNILSCSSPYHEKGEPFRPEMLEATVDETAGTGVQVHMLQPAMGWVPWWQSKVYPVEEHQRWWEEWFGVDLARDAGGGGSVHEYLLNGGDLVAVFIARCRQRGLIPFISLRLNDGHHLELVETPGNTRALHSISRFYAEHPEYRIGPDLKDWDQHVQNWAIPEVRAHKLAFIEELCENYDLDGFELDFMRHSSFFQVDRTTSAGRARIMTDFCAQVRSLLDRTAKSGQHRWLCVRVPCYLAAYDDLGLDLSAMVKAGVDMVNLSAHYFTEQQTDLPAICHTVSDASNGRVAVYLEMTHCTATGRRLTVSGGDNFVYRRTTDEQFYTTAHQAYARGADGLSAFNFVYYREHGTPGRGPFNEPPFHVFSHLGDPAWLARQPQHYILGNVWDRPRVPDRQLPKKVMPGEAVTFTLDMAPPPHGWRTDGKLRIQGEASLGASQWAAQFNGADLERSDDVSEPYTNPYPPCLGTPDQMCAWVVPAHSMRDRVNTIQICLTAGEPAQIEWLDLAVR
jgi:hypothetical protein